MFDLLTKPQALCDSDAVTIPGSLEALSAQALRARIGNEQAAISQMLEHPGATKCRITKARIEDKLDLIADLRIQLSRLEGRSF